MDRYIPAFSVLLLGLLATGISSAAELPPSEPIQALENPAAEKPLTTAGYCLRRSLEFTSPLYRSEWRSACRENYGSVATSVPLDSVEKGNIDAVVKEALEQEARANVRLEYCLRRAGDITNSQDAVVFARACERTEEDFRIGKAPEPTFEQNQRDVDDVVAVMNSDCAALSTKDARTMCFQEWWNGVLPQLVAIVKQDHPSKVERMTREYQQCFETMADSKPRLQDCIKGKMQILSVSPSTPSPQQAPSIWDRIGAALMGFGAGFQGNSSVPAYSPSVGGYSYPSSSTPPGFERDLNGNLRAQTPYGSNEFFDRQQQLQGQRQLQQRDQFQQQWREIQQRTYRQQQGGRWCQGDC